MSNLRNNLYTWRAQTAEREGVELFRVLPTATISEILLHQPKTMAELLLIKGIKEGKASKYGQAILDMVNAVFGNEAAPIQGEAFDSSSSNSGELQEPLTVSSYLDRINNLVQGVHTKVVGEVGGRVDVRDRWTYFSILDKTDKSVLSVMVANRNLQISGVNLEEGLEIAITGAANIYKPTGRLTFMADMVEYVGEGALKKAYDDLKKRLTLEGIFADIRKRAIPEFPERIGVITSRTGAVIHDFQNNLGHFGYAIRFLDSRVEGAQAVPDILSAINRMVKEDIDVLVLMRGGGSLESLQAFNNEEVIRAVCAFPVPVICAIGHDKDVPLVCLAADAAPSTPTAATILLNQSWNTAFELLRRIDFELLSVLERIISGTRERLAGYESTLGGVLNMFYRRAESLVSRFTVSVTRVEQIVENNRLAFRDGIKAMLEGYTILLRQTGEYVTQQERFLAQVDPKRQLKLGYSIVRSKGKLLRSVEKLSKGMEVEVELGNGRIDATIERIHPNQ